MWGSGHSSRNGHPKNKHIISRTGEKTHVEFPLRLDALVDDPLYKIVCDPLFVMSFLLMVKKKNTFILPQVELTALNLLLGSAGRTNILNMLR